MEKTIKKLKLIFMIVFGQFVLIGGGAFALKHFEIMADMIDISNKITVVIPILMIASILISYFVYDRIAKSSQKIEEEEIQLKKFFTASMVKIVMLDFVGLLVVVMLLLFYQKTYLYMLGIIVVFFLLNFPNELKFKKDFKSKREGLFDN